MSGNFFGTETSSFFPSAQTAAFSASPSLSPGQQSQSLLFMCHFTIDKVRALLAEPLASPGGPSGTSMHSPTVVTVPYVKHRCSAGQSCHQSPWDLPHPPHPPSCSGPSSVHPRTSCCVWCIHRTTSWTKAETSGSSRAHGGHPAAKSRAPHQALRSRGRVRSPAPCLGTGA